MKSMILCAFLALTVVTTTWGQEGMESSFRLLSSYATGIFDDSGAETVAYDPSSQRFFFTDASNNAVGILSMDGAGLLSRVGTIDLTPYGAGVNSVTAHDGMIAVAMQAVGVMDNGFVSFFDTNGNYLKSVEVGVLPDMVTFNHAGTQVITANEGEPSDDYTIDPLGSVSIIDLSGGLDLAQAMTLDFAMYNSDVLRASGVRIFGPNATAGQDLEPEYVAVSPDDQYAYVVLQENNAIAKINLITANIDAIVPLGYKDHSIEGQGLDASNRTDNIDIRTWPVLGMYQPDAIKTFTGPDDQVYIVSANEGDSRDYAGYSEEARVGDLALDSTTYPDAAVLQAEDQLGRIKTTTALGIDADGVTQQIYTYGARSFSVWDADGNLVWDSGDEFEQRLAQLAPTTFNSNNDHNDSYKSRSDDKGAEPEAIEVMTVGDRILALIGLERQGGVFVYDVTTPQSPTFVEYFNNRNFAVAADDPAAGDLGPEDIKFIPAAVSPTGQDMIVVANEVSGTVSAYSYGTGSTGGGGMTAECEISNSTVSVLYGGTEIDRCIGDVYVPMSYRGTGRGNYHYIITDEDNMILDFQIASQAVDLSGAPDGVCRVWGYQSDGTITPVVGSAISTLESEGICGVLSTNYVTVNRITSAECDEINTCVARSSYVSTTDGRIALRECVGDITFSMRNIIGTSEGVYQYIITDVSNTILATSSSVDIDLSDAPEGVCRIWGFHSDVAMEIELGQPAVNLEVGCGKLSTNYVTVDRTTSCNDGGTGGGSGSCPAVESTVVNLDGGDNVSVCAGDAVIHMTYRISASGGAFLYVITDTDNTILAYTNDTPVDLSGAPAGTCRIWGYHSDGVTPVVGEPATSLVAEGVCGVLSANFITVVREAKAAPVTTEVSLCPEESYVWEIDGAIYTEVGTYTVADESCAADQVLVISRGSEESCGTTGGGGMESCPAVESTVVNIEGGDSISVCATEAVINLTYRTDNTEGTYQFVITDTENTILGFTNGTPVDLSGAPAGTCRIWGYHSDGVTPVIGESASTLEGDEICGVLSDNYITVLRLPKREDSIVEVELCSDQSYTWELNGETYSEEGVYTISSSNCESDQVLIISHLSDEECGIGTSCSAQETQVSSTDGSDVIVRCVGDVVIEMNQQRGIIGDYLFVITDEDNSILGFSSDPIIDLSGAPAGVCRIWGYNGEAEPLVGESATTLIGEDICGELSVNYITVIREEQVVEVTSATICEGESYTWDVDGETYTETTTLEIVGPDCGPVYILELVVSEEDDCAPLDENPLCESPKQLMSMDAGDGQIIKWERVIKAKSYVIELSNEDGVFTTIPVRRNRIKLSSCLDQAYTIRVKAICWYGEESVYTRPIDIFLEGTMDMDAHAATNRSVDNSLRGLIIEEEIDFSVYPNPTQSALFIATNAMQKGVAEITLIDIAGKMVMRMQQSVAAGNQELFIDIANIHEGAYILQVNIAGEVMTERIIKQ